MNDEDFKYVERCLTGDVEAFEEIIDKYRKPVFRLAIRMVKDFDDAEDIAQNVFIKVYERLGTFNPKYKFFSWLYRIAVNETINFCRKKNLIENLADNFESSGNNPEEAFSESELSEKIQAALIRIDFSYRLPLVLRHFLSYSYKEISEILEVPEKTVKSRLFTGRQMLKDELIISGVKTND